MSISALILTKNEEEMIEDCLKQLDFADEIIVMDQKSIDKTVGIAKKYTHKIFTADSEEFDKNREKLAQLAQGDWLLYVDADERLPGELIGEIKQAIKTDLYSAFYFPRKNYILGKWLKHGGWWPDYVPRLFKKSQLAGWHGPVHESPEVRGEFGYTQVSISHFTARSISTMFSKSRKWAKVEAELFYRANHPKVTILKVTKSVLTEFFNRYFAKKGFLDGQVGLIEAIYQALHQAIILTYLWELQNDSKHQKFSAL